MKISIVFWLLLFCIGTYSLFSGGLDQLAIRSVKELWNIGHIVYFALTVYLLAKLKFMKRVPLPYQWLGFIMFSLFWGTLIEVLQYDTDRTPDLADISRDMTGCLLVLSFHPAMLKLSSTVSRLIIRLTVAIILLVQLMPLAVALTDETIARFQFPVLSDFSTPFELDRWGRKAGRAIVQLDAGQDNSQLKIDLTTSTYSGAGMKFFPSDWRAYQSINLKIFKPADQPLSIVIRIHDAQHQTGSVAYAHSDRFNTRVNLNEGWNDISIPLSRVEAAPYRRKMDLSQIRDVSFFATRLPEPRVVYLDKIYLSR